MREISAGDGPDGVGDLAAEYADVQILNVGYEYRTRGRPDTLPSYPESAHVTISLSDDIPSEGTKHLTCDVQFTLDGIAGILESVTIEPRWGDGDFPDWDFLALAVAALAFDAPTFDEAWHCYTERDSATGSKTGSVLRPESENETEDENENESGTE